MRVVTLVCLVALALTIAFAGAASANVDFWLTQAGSSTPITSGSTIFVNPGDPVNMSAWYTTDEYAGMLNFMLGYASTTGYGDTATPLTTPLLTTAYPEAQWSSGAAYWPTNNFASGFVTMYPSLGGGYHPTPGAIRPWGLFQGGYFAADEPRTDQRVFDFHFGSVLDYGDSVTLTIWDASTVGQIGDQDIWTTDLLNMDLITYRPGDNYTVTFAVEPEVIVPEPSALLALLTGLTGMAGFAYSRRRK